MTEERDLPRRCYMDLWTPAEIAIGKAMDAVEAMTADVRLTDAVILLSQARAKVADFIDGIEPSAPLVSPSSNYVCDKEESPTEVTFADGRVVKITFDDHGNPYLDINPIREYPKPCGICAGVIQSKDDLDWHGYGNCREIPEPIMKQMGAPLVSETPQRGDSVVGRTVDEEHRPLVCFVCGKRFGITFNFCQEHKDEYERLKKSQPISPQSKAPEPRTENNMNSTEEKLQRVTAEREQIMKAIYVVFDEESGYEVPAEPEPLYFDSLAEAVKCDRLTQELKAAGAALSSPSPAPPRMMIDPAAPDEPHEFSPDCRQYGCTEASPSPETEKEK